MALTTGRRQAGDARAAAFSPARKRAAFLLAERLVGKPRRDRRHDRGEACRGFEFGVVGRTAPGAIAGAAPDKPSDVRTGL
ncbi:hypothetical protein AZF01_22205 (plasmid) [Martelella sp. AD-3]|nr:hypothetical protein AZF01_22205 [Martelella sp. AD-3]